VRPILGAHLNDTVEGNVSGVVGSMDDINKGSTRDCQRVVAMIVTHDFRLFNMPLGMHSQLKPKIC
jgi:hypothetical protein